MSGNHQAVVRQSSGSRQAVVRQSSGSRLAVVRQSSGSLQAVVRQLSNFLSLTFLIHFAALEAKGHFSLVKDFFLRFLYGM